MAKADNKTQQTPVSPAKFIADLTDGVRKQDAMLLLDWFEHQTGWPPRMWGPSIIGYGRYHYTYDSGREGDALITGFSPRKSSMSIYVMPGYAFPDMQDKLARLGKHKLGKSCLYINKISDVDMSVLAEIVASGVKSMRENYDTWDV